MRVAKITELGSAPAVLQSDSPDPGAELIVDMEAVSINPVDIAIGAGTFYAGHPPLPYVPCIEGVGRRDGRLVYVMGTGLGIARDGVAAGRVAVPAAALVELPFAADPVLSAALGTAGLAGWLSVQAAELGPHDVVVVLGATGAVGGVALQAARLGGARRVVAVGRSSAKLGELIASSDAQVALDGDAPFAQRLLEAAGGPPTVVIDMLWGQPLLDTLGVVANRARIVQLGASAGPVAALPSAAVRGKQLRIIGYSNFGLSRDELASAYLTLVDHSIAGRVGMHVSTFPLADIGAAWDSTRSSVAKAVVTIGEGDR
jgi:NADPH:quinone reductase-like Zn-dependent oxidoreductase